MIASLIVAAVSLATLVYLAAEKQPLPHLAVAAVTGLLLAGLAIAENRRLHAAGASKNAVSSVTGRHMAVVWLWGAAGLLITYLFFRHWPEWWTFFAAFLVLGLVSVFFSVQSARDERAGRDDPAMQKLARGLTIGLLVGMVVTMAGLLIDGKMTRFLDPTERWEDWAANNIFFFGAFALALIGANALWTSRAGR